MAIDLPSINQLKAQYDDTLDWQLQSIEALAWVKSVRNTPPIYFETEKCLGGDYRYPLVIWQYKNIAYIEKVLFANPSDSSGYKALDKFKPEIQLI